MHILIAAGPLWAIKLWSICLQFVSLQPCKSFQYCIFVSVQPCKSFWSCKFTAYILVACIITARMFRNCKLTTPLNRHFTFHLACYLRSWGSRESSKFDEFSTMFRHPQRPPKVTPRAPKTYQNDIRSRSERSQTRCPDLLFVLRIQPPRGDHLLLTNSMKKQLSNSTCHWGIQDHKFMSRKSRK